MISGGTIETFCPDDPNAGQAWMNDEFHFRMAWPRTGRKYYLDIPDGAYCVSASLFKYDSETMFLFGLDGQPWGGIHWTIKISSNEEMNRFMDSFVFSDEINIQYKEWLIAAMEKQIRSAQDKAVPPA